LKTLGADVTIDTRLNPAYPRNAVLATAAWERVAFDTGGTLHRTRLEGTGYLGLLGQTVLAARVSRDGTNGPQPAYLRPLLGGWSNLRGFKAGAFVGDIVVTGSVELFAPLTSPLYMGRLGVSAFVDTGTAYDYGQRLKDQIRYTGVGGSVWMTATVFRLSLSVAHGRGAGTRVNFGGGFTF
jgi:outer membrane protein assembly factor BamA